MSHKRSIYDIFKSSAVGKNPPISQKEDMITEKRPRLQISADEDNSVDTPGTSKDTRKQGPGEKQAFLEDEVTGDDRLVSVTAATTPDSEEGE